jgi:DNA-binding MarR family transcriptional regulator
MEQTSRMIQFTGLLNSAMKSIQSMKMEKMAAFNLSAAHTNCLCRLAESEDGLSQRELAELEAMDKAQVSRVMRELEEKDYVQSTGGSYKRRYTLTESGAEMARQVENIILSLNNFVSRDIPLAELDTFYSVLNEIVKNLAVAETLVSEGRDGALYR